MNLSLLKPELSNFLGILKLKKDWGSASSGMTSSVPGEPEHEVAELLELGSKERLKKVGF